MRTMKYLLRRARRALALSAAALPTALLAQGATPAPDAAANSGKSIWTQNVSANRKSHGAAGLYTKKWDLSDLPHYKPKRQLTGTLRIWGNNYLTDGQLGEYWREAFKKFQPGIKIKYHLPTGTIAVAALATGVADLGMNYKATLSDRLVFEQTFHYPLSELAAVTGSYNVYGWGPAGIIVVNKDNPLKQLSIQQLDGIFGGARRGGYEGSVWHTDYPYKRGPEGNIRTWGQLGLTGEWADKPIHTCGQNLSSGAMLNFSNEVLGGSLQFVENYDAYTNYVMPDGKTNMWSTQVQQVLANDKYMICYASPMTLSPVMHEVALQARSGGAFVERTLDSVHDNSYPLVNHGYFFFNRAPGKPVDPKVEEFIRFVLSQEGQQEVQREGRYIPLTAELVKKGLEVIK